MAHWITAPYTVYLLRTCRESTGVQYQYTVRYSGDILYIYSLACTWKLDAGTWYRGCICVSLLYFSCTAEYEKNVDRTSSLYLVFSSSARLYCRCTVPIQLYRHHSCRCGTVRPRARNPGYRDSAVSGYDPSPDGSQSTVYRQHSHRVSKINYQTAWLELGRKRACLHVEFHDHVATQYPSPRRLTICLGVACLAARRTQHRTVVSLACPSSCRASQVAGSYMFVQESSSSHSQVPKSPPRHPPLGLHVLALSKAALPPSRSDVLEAVVVPPPLATIFHSASSPSLVCAVAMGVYPMHVS